MKPQGTIHTGRIAAFFLIGALGLLSVGDRAFAIITRGIDPLDTLDRTAKPNVIVVLDNSTSMRNTSYFNGGVGPGTGDWALSKLAVAKSVLQTTIANNQSRANFMLASFQQSAPPAFTTGSDRFYYVLSSTSAPAFAGTPFTFSNWQDIQAGWNTLYWQESSGTAPINPVITIGAGVNDKIYFREARSTAFLDRYRTCTVTLPASLYGAHGNGTADPNFATLLAGLNPLLTSANGSARSCTTVGGGVGTTPDNDYILSYNTGTFTFTLTVDPAGASTGTPREYQILFDSNTLMDDLGFPASLPHTGLTLANPGVPNAADYQQLATNPGADVSTVGIVNPVACSASVPATFYSSGLTLATALTTAMNAALPSCTPTPGSNTYAVTFDAVSGVFTFARATGTLPFQIKWSTGAPNNIAGVMGKAGAGDTSFVTSTTSGATTRLADYQALNSQTTDVIGGITTTNYALAAGRFFNGQTLRVDATGAVCSLTAGSATSPPSVLVQPTLAGCGADTGGPSTFQLAGANWGTDVSGTGGIPGTGSCQGYRSVVDLVACNTATPQTTTFATALSPGLILNPGSPHAPTGYTEVTADGSYRVSASPSATGLIAFANNTPLASTIDGVRGAFTTLWGGGNFGLTAISSHALPRERTIVVLITDGNDTCAVDSGAATDNNALAAAYQAERLYTPLSGTRNPDGTFTTGTDVSSTATTYVVGFGNGINTAIDTNRLNWIAWGGSGMGLNSTTPVTNNGTRWNSTPTQAQREQCATCTDAFIALDGAALTTVLQAVIDQATSSEGVFSATQAIQASPFEMADVITGVGSYDPKTRYDVLVPLGFESIFTMPGFRGTIRAISNQGGTPTVFWDAGQKLLTSIQTTMNVFTGVNSPSGITGEASFNQLGGELAVINSTTTGAGIKRRIYTTAGNGTFPVVDSNFARLFAGDSPCRVQLWPPAAGPAAPDSGCLPKPTGNGAGIVAPPDDLIEGLLDVALGLPSDAAIAADPTTTFNNLQSYYEVCMPTPPASVAPSANCSSATPETKTKRARREARENILAYVAGASVALDTAGYPKRATTASAGKWALGDIIYRARPWVMAESTLSSAAVVGPPIEITPGTTGYVDEYNKYRDGPRNPSDVGQNGLAQGFGLRNPDKDSTSNASPGDDGRTALKPVMTVVYVGANDMLHAFRAGPSCNAPGGTFAYTCTENGGEELWGFVPFDKLFALRNLLKPQTRGNKTYIIASGVRFADAFFNAPGGTYSATIGGVNMTGRGMWRQVLAFGRGQGGKSYTVLDVTARGRFTGLALDTPGPQVLWNRGNPDTVDGTPSGGANGSGADTAAYGKMGETWAVPAISFVDKNLNNGASVVMYTGSGYGDSANAGEGSFFYTFDATTGSVIGSVDIDAAATTNGVARTGLAYPNAIVAGPAAYSSIQLTPLQAGHPSEITTRAYFGDVHGRLWKVNSASPGTAVLMADLGVDQPVGVPPALIALGSPVKPYVFATSGNDNRVVADFKIFGFKDDSGSDTNNSAGTRTAAAADATVFAYPPQSVNQFVRVLADAAANKYRGTIQPATAFTDGSPVNGRVFFGGTRFTGFSGTIPCLATFNTIIFALGAETGGAAYDLSSGDDAYVVFSNSRKLAIQVIRQPGATADATSQPAKLYLDEGLMSGSTSPNPPAPPGYAAAIVPQPPNVVMTLRGGATNSVFPQFAAPRICQ